MSSTTGCYIKKKKRIMEEDGWSKSITAEAHGRRHQTYQASILQCDCCSFRECNIHETLLVFWIYFKALYAKKPVELPAYGDVCSHFFFSSFRCVSRILLVHFSINWSATIIHSRIEHLKRKHILEKVLSKHTRIPFYWRPSEYLSILLCFKSIPNTYGNIPLTKWSGQLRGTAVHLLGIALSCGVFRNPI